MNTLISTTRFLALWKSRHMVYFLIDYTILHVAMFNTYPQIKNAKTDRDRKAYRKRSLDYLERYIYLILFNTYLHGERRDKWKRSFKEWLTEVGH